MAEHINPTEDIITGYWATLYKNSISPK